MIPNNALENRLNKIREGSPAPEPPSDKIELINKQQNNNVVNKQSPKEIVIISFFELISSLLISILYGFGFETIFNQNWNFIGLLGVGFIFHQFLTYINNIFKPR